MQVTVTPEMQLEVDNLVLWHDNTRPLVSETRRMIGNLVKMGSVPDRQGEVAISPEFIESFVYANVIPFVIVSYLAKFNGPDDIKHTFGPEVQRLAAKELTIGIMDEIELGEYGYGSYRAS